MDNLPFSRIVELRWPVMGDRLPADHNYRLYSAMIQQEPELKNIDWQLLTITGIPDGNGWIKLGRQSRLGIRCPLQELHRFTALDNQIIRIGQNLLELGESCGEAISPSQSLQCRVVTIKTGYTCRVNEFQFGVAVGKQLQSMGIHSMPHLGDRKALKIKNNMVVGYSIRFEDLRPEESMLLQTKGIGGRRRLGCGVFEPQLVKK